MAGVLIMRRFVLAALVALTPSVAWGQLGPAPGVINGTLALGGPINVPFNPVTGASQPVLGQQVDSCTTMGGNTQQEYCLNVNMTDMTGGGGAAITNTNQKVGEFVSVNVVPGGSNAWATNFDIVQRSGVGNYPFFNSEFDLTNFNQDFPVGGSVSANLFVNFLSSFPVTAGIYGAATTSGGAFATHDFIFGNGATLAEDNFIADGTSATHGLLEGGTHSVAILDSSTSTTGLQINGTHSSQDILLSDSPPSALNFTGTNSFAAIVTQGGSAARVFVAKSGQPACFNGINNCISYGGSGYVITNSANATVVTISDTGAVTTASTVVASLAACTTTIKGQRLMVTDAVLPTFLGPLTGGGTVMTPVFCNGTAWVAG